MCDTFTLTAHGLWRNWIKSTLKRTEELVRLLDCTSPDLGLQGLAVSVYILSNFREIYYFVYVAMG